MILWALWALAGLILTPSPAYAAPEAACRQKAADAGGTPWTLHETAGLESREIRLRFGDGSLARMVAVRLDLARFQVRLRWQATGGTAAAGAADVARMMGAAVVVNAGYFDENGRPLGYFLAGGKVYNRRVLFRGRPAALHLGTLFTVREEGGRVAIVTREAFRPEGVRDAFQAGPYLVRGGAPVAGLERYREFRRPARRTVAAFGPSGRLIFLVSEENSRGMSWCELQAFLSRPGPEGGLGVAEAMNLDGGSSSQLFVRSGGYRRYLTGRRVPAFIVVIPKGARTSWPAFSGG